MPEECQDCLMETPDSYMVLQPDQSRVRLVVVALAVLIHLPAWQCLTIYVCIVILLDCLSRLIALFGSMASGRESLLILQWCASSCLALSILSSTIIKKYKPCNLVARRLIK